MDTSLSELVDEALTERVEDLKPFPAERRAQELFAESERLQIAGLRCLAKVDRASVPIAFGYTRTERYVAHTLQVTPQQAAESTATARLIAGHELTGKAITDGHIGLAHASLLARAAAKFPDQYTAGEASLVELASTQDLDRFTHSIARWRHDADLDAATENTSHRHNTRGIWLQRRLDGSGTGRVDLDPLAFAAVRNALDAAAGKPDPHDALIQRSLPQRRADALVEMALPYGAEEDGTEVPKPHGRHFGASIEAVINLNFDGREPALHHMLSDIHGSGPVPHTIIEQLSCDANWQRVMAAPSRILNYSSPVADITPTQRRALRIRDHHCQFHGCNRPWHWCDVHHIISRHDGGPTTLDNLLLMCRYHHTLLHQGGWTFTRDPATGQTQTRSP